MAAPLSGAVSAALAPSCKHCPHRSRTHPAVFRTSRNGWVARAWVYPFDLGIPKRVFEAADGRYEVATCTADGRPVRTNADFSITVEHGPEALRTVIVPPFHIPDREAPAT